MKKKLLAFLVCSVFSISLLHAQYYPASLIADSLKLNAHCVIREFVTELELHSVNSGSERVKKVYTILDKEGQASAAFREFYDGSSSISINEITIYDALGKKIRKIKDVEIIDIPAYSGSLFADDRLKYFKPDYAEFPYTIVYDYESTYRNMISYGRWQPIESYNQSVEGSRYTIVYPTEIMINKKEVDVSSQQSVLSGGKTAQIWAVKNLKAVENEVYSGGLSEKSPVVYLMPSQLVWGKYRGSADSWKDYGKWEFSLYDGRSELSDAEKVKITALTKDIPDTLQRIKALYSYMQEHTRYVGVQIGIGGFQPFDAKTVYEMGYGDCKALSNYMHSLLKFVGIKSHPALVGAGSDIKPIFMDFPNFNQFNHVILAVPQMKDTIWLECTDQLAPFGFLGNFTDDRDALLLTDRGGVLVHTKKYTALENSSSSTSHIFIDSLGGAQCELSSRYSALQYNQISSLFYSNYDEQKKWLYSELDFPSPQLTNFSITQTKLPIPVATINQSVTSRNYCSFSGNYMVMPLNVVNTVSAISKMLKPRLSDIIIERSYTDADTIIYQIPNSYKIESLPTGKTIESKFGRYNYSVVANGSKISYIRNCNIIQGVFKPDEYKELYNFFLSMAKADGTKMMLSKKM